MIVPQPRTGRGRQHAVAAFATTVLVVLTYIGLQVARVPAFGAAGAMVRSLDPLFLERFAVPPKPTRSADRRRDDLRSVAQAASASSAGDVEAALDELVRRFEATGSAVEGSPDRRETALPQGIVREPKGQDADRFDELFGSTRGPLVAPSGRRDRPASGAASVGIEIQTAVGRTPTSSVDKISEGVDLEVSTPVHGGRDPDPTEAPVVTIREFEPESFQALDVDYLGLWMGNNPGELPVGVKVHVNHLPGFSTAVVPFVSEGSPMELYLMYNESLRELHILFVEGDRSVYLIDRGFREQSRSLREGTVRRLDGEIVAIRSRTGAASSARAREFYNVFLSWWEVAKKDVER